MVGMWVVQTGPCHPVTCLASAMPRPRRLCRIMQAILDAMDAMPLSAVRDCSAASRARKTALPPGKRGEGLTAETLSNPPWSPVLRNP